MHVPKVLQSALRFFVPFAVVDRQSMMRYTACLALSIAVLWWNVKIPFIPKLGEVTNSFGVLWAQQGLVQNLWISFKLYVHALTLSIFASCTIAYLSSLPAFNPFAKLASTFRFIGMAGLVFIFTVYFGAGRTLEVAMLTFAISAFLTTSLIDIVNGVSQDAKDHARTLRMGPWRVLWETTILGTADLFYDAIRQNAAIGWMMLTSVEALARSEGGIGVMLLNQDKHLILPAVFAIQSTFYILGLGQDMIIAWVKRIIFASILMARSRRLA